MKKNIKDYLHLYLGCECLWEDKQDATGGRTELDLHTLLMNQDFDCSVKPILRPLSDMTEEEGVKFLNLIYESIYGSKSSIVTAEKVTEHESVGFICYNSNNNRISVTLEIDKGIDFYVTGNKLDVRQFDLTKYLLSKHFDLFGLIEAGLAIDKTTIK